MVPVQTSCAKYRSPHVAPNLKDTLSKVAPWSPLPLRGLTDAESKQRWDGGGVQNRAFLGTRGCTVKNGALLCGAAAPKPQCFGRRQPYGGARDRVWELELGLGLQAKAKAATRRYAGAYLTLKL